MIGKIKAVAVFMGAKRLPFKAVKVTKSENGERVIEGVKSFVDSFPDIPWGHRDVHGNWIVYSRQEREALHLQAVARKERAAKRAAKGKAPIKSKVKAEEPAISFYDAMTKIATSAPVQTVKRAGKWVQVGADALTAHIEAR